MIGTTIVNTLSTIVINVLSNCVYEGKQKEVDTVKLSILKKEIDEWIEEYCLKNDGSILLSSALRWFIDETFRTTLRYTISCVAGGLQPGASCPGQSILAQ